MKFSTDIISCWSETHETWLDCYIPEEEEDQGSTNQTTSTTGGATEVWIELDAEATMFDHGTKYRILIGPLSINPENRYELYQKHRSSNYDDSIFDFVAGWGTQQTDNHDLKWLK